MASEIRVLRISGIWRWSYRHSRFIVPHPCPSPVLNIYVNISCRRKFYLETTLREHLLMTFSKSPAHSPVLKDKDNNYISISLFIETFTSIGRSLRLQMSNISTLRQIMVEQWWLSGRQEPPAARHKAMKLWKAYARLWERSNSVRVTFQELLIII